MGAEHGGTWAASLRLPSLEDSPLPPSETLPILQGPAQILPPPGSCPEGTLLPRTTTFQMAGSGGGSFIQPPHSLRT